MFVENQNNSSMIDQLSKIFQNISISGKEIKSYTNLQDEYNALKYGVGVVVSFNKTIIKLTGNDALDFLHRISTNDVKELKPFHVVSTLFLNEKGRFIDRTNLLNLENHFILIGNSNHNRLLNWINKYIITEDIQTKNVTDDFVVIDFIGPQSESFLTLLLGEEIKSLNGDNIVDTNVDGFNFFSFINNEDNSLKYFRILLQADKFLNFADYLMENKSVFDLNFIGKDAYEIFRIENAIPAYPSEINDEINPHENNLIHEVSFTKGCYIGQEVIARLDTYDKVQWNLVKITFDKPIETELPITVFNELKEEVGEITSLAYSPITGQSIGLGFLRKKKISSKEKLFVEYDLGRIYLSTTESKH